MIERWESRLAKMDHSKGTSDKMRKAAMLAEIKDLREAHKLGAAAIRQELTKERRRAKDAQASAVKWRNHFSELRKMHLKLKKELPCEQSSFTQQRTDTAFTRAESVSAASCLNGH